MLSFVWPLKITILNKTTSLLIYSILAKNEYNFLISRRYFAISGTFVPIILCTATVWKIYAISLQINTYKPKELVGYIVMVGGLSGINSQICLKYM